jgi:hypothetical protein
MRKRALIGLAAAGLLAAAVPAGSALAAPGGGAGPLTLAVYGDSPYGVAAYPPGGQSGDTAELQKSPAFISTINADASVSEVIHVGDLHSGKTSAPRRTTTRSHRSGSSTKSRWSTRRETTSGPIATRPRACPSRARAAGSTAPGC